MKFYDKEEVEGVYKLPPHPGRIWQCVLFRVLGKVSIANCKVKGKDEKDHYYLMYSFNGFKWFNSKVSYPLHHYSLIYDRQTKTVVLSVKGSYKLKDGTIRQFYNIIQTTDGINWKRLNIGVYNIFSMSDIYRYNNSYIVVCKCRISQKRAIEYILYSTDTTNWEKAKINIYHDKDDIKPLDGVSKVISISHFKFNKESITCSAILNLNKKNRNLNETMVSTDGKEWSIYEKLKIIDSDKEKAKEPSDNEEEEIEDVKLDVEEEEIKPDNKGDTEIIEEYEGTEMIFVQ